MEAYREGKGSALTARYRELRERHYGRGGYDFGERSLDELGLELVKDGDVEGAIAVLRLNAEQFPASGAVYDHLAGAYLEAGERELAGVFYRKSLEVDPTNEEALKRLRELDRPPAGDPTGN